MTKEQQIALITEIEYTIRRYEKDSARREQFANDPAKSDVERSAFFGMKTVTNDALADLKLILELAKGGSQ